MISFRYHIVSIVSVFLALAIGVALGGGPLKGTVDNTLVDQVHADRHVKRQLNAEIATLRNSDSFTDSFAQTAAPGLLGHQLRGQAVTLVLLPTAVQTDVDGLKSFVKVAGGTVVGTLRVGKQLLDAGHKQLVDELGTQLENRASDVSVPSAASPYERIGALIARAIGTQKRSGARVDGTATSILAGLSTTSLMSSEGRLSRRGDLVLVVTGPGEGGVQQQQGAGTIVTALVQAVDAGTRGVVLAGPALAAQGHGLIKAVRDDVKAAKAVSTVDTLGRTAGQVVSVMALVGQSKGRSGQYGSVDAPDGSMPGARTTGQ